MGIYHRNEIISYEIICCHISDHYPITLHWHQDDFHGSFPFKFNRIWLEDPTYSDLVKEIWCREENRYPSHMRSFIEKLWILRQATKKWEINKKRHLNGELEAINKELMEISPLLTGITLPIDIRCRIRALQNRRLALLLIKETTWKLKSRAIWIRDGDRNTKFFHSYANFRRHTESIWEIYDSDGNKCQTQQDISRATSTFFQHAYVRKTIDCLEDQLWGIKHYLIMFDDVVNHAPFNPVSAEEIHEVLNSFHGDKIPGPDGWTIELFTHFFDLLRADLVNLVEDS